MKVSAGCLLTNDEKLVLIVHPTNGKLWDIPKGLIENNECPEDTMRRELKEETGIQLVDENDWSKLYWKLICAGQQPYIKGKKDLVLYIIIVHELPDIKSLHCASTFKDKNSQSIPEIDDYKYVHIAELPKYLTKNMLNVIERSLDECSCLDL